MPERDPRGADAVGGRLQRGVACGARGGLDRARRNAHADDVDGHAEARAERPHELGVARGVGTQAVVDVQDVQPQVEGSREAEQDVEQRDGVGAARDADQDGFAAREHRVAADGALGRVDEVHVSRPAGPPRPRRPRSAPSSTPGRCA